MRKNLAFTLVELLVVMAITAILLALGIAAMNYLRNSVQFEEAKNSIITTINTAENRARNSVKSNRTNDNVDGYAVFFSNNNYSLYYCNFVSGSTYNCSSEAANLKPAAYDRIRIAPVSGGCGGMMFERLSTDLKVFEEGPNYLARDTLKCIFEISHLDTGQVNYLHIDPSEDTFEVNASQF